MKSLNVNIEKEIYKIIQPIATINIYKVANSRGFFEITRNKYNGEWKILVQSNTSNRLPLKPIGKVIEEELGIIN